ncbi:MAG: GIY-YIG nuclease family protein [Sphingobacteriaceae bacterium]|nr:GIY-YIG nuclease family protein [Sphingobacteriaceae bacterium]
MSFYVYVIQSEFDGSFYKGFSENYIERLNQHNNAWSKYTSTKMPWKLVHVEIFTDKKSTLKREKVLKKYSHAQLQQLFQSGKNILNITAVRNPQ